MEWKTTRVQGDGEGDHPAAGGGDGAPPEPAAGLVIARRYTLTRCLGRGGHGDVWESSDALTGDVVAVKLLGAESAPACVRKEVSALRLLRVPGVVVLLDEGTDRGRHFLVMERVEGSPFPGARVAPTWAALEPVATALLETLARIHAVGVVHRDLKPGNVLVRPDGQPTVLDFGLAYGALGDSTARGAMVGTPAYMAPEQAQGLEATARADLYAAGVMLYEALAGRLPYQAAGLYEVLFAKLCQEPAPLRDVAPGVPPAVAAVIDRMVSRAPSDRPSSAAEVLRLLRGEAGARRGDDELPRLGDSAAGSALLGAVRAGRSVALVGPHGSGRSRALRDLAAALSAEGRPVMATAPGRRPFASLEPVIGEPDGGLERVEDVAADARARLRARLAAGAVLLVDDAEQVDPWSAAAITSSLDAGGVVRALLPDEHEGGEAVLLPPLSEASLRELFSGPERIFHVPSDAAHALWARTEGWPARVADELCAWVRAGLARRDGDRFAIDREALDRLAAGQRITAPWRGAMSSRVTNVPRPRLPSHLEDLLAWMALAWPHTSTATLAAARREPTWRVEAEARELERLQAVRRLADGRWEPGVPVTVEAAWTSDRRGAAHRALAAALPPGTEGRLVHLAAGVEDGGAAGDAAAELAREAVALAHARAAEGLLGQAITALSDGLLAARRVGPPGERAVPLFSAWLALALEAGTPRALDRLLYEVLRTPALAPATVARDLRAVVQAALALTNDPARALGMAEEIAPFEDPSLERCRGAIRVRAARAVPPERAERVLDEIERWAAGLPSDPAVQSSVAAWRGARAYRRGLFDEAAVHYDRAAALAPWASTRVAALCESAASWMEAFRFEEAAGTAARARHLAEQYRMPWREADAEWVLRTVAYRRGVADVADPDFVLAASRLGVPDMEALVAITEAAIAWRGGDPALAAALAARARERWSAMGLPLGASFARSLEAACGAPMAPDEADALAAWAARCETSGVGVQALALLATRWRERAAEWRAAAHDRAGLVPRERWHLRQDVLSVVESLAIVGGR